MTSIRPSESLRPTGRIRNCHLNGQRCIHWHILLMGSSTEVLLQTAALIGEKHSIPRTRSIGVDQTNTNHLQGRCVTFFHPASALIYSLIQMLHMATESEVIRKLRYQVDNFDEQQELQEGSGGNSKKMAPDINHHVQLCAPDTNRTTISAYCVTLQQEHGITDFLKSLSSFFKSGNLESDVYSYMVCLELGIFLHPY